MYRQHVSPQTQNKRTSSLICGAKRRTGARIATFGLIVLVAGQLMLPGVALAAEMPETVAGQDAAATAVTDPAAPVIAKQAAVAPAATADVAASSVMDAELAAPAAAATESAPAAAQDTAETEAAVAPADDSTAALAPKSVATSPAAAPASRGATNPGGGKVIIDTTVVNHFYDLELPPAFTLIQGETFVYDFPDAPEDFTLWHNESVYFFKIDPDTEALVKTDNPKEANVSISLAAIDNHERATLVFTGGGADPLISYSLDLLHLICIGALADFDFSNYNNGEGTILETRHEYFIRCVFGSNVYLIATDTTDPAPDPGAKPDPDVKPDPETKTEFAPQSEAKNPVADSVSAKTAAVVEPAKTALPATGDSDAVAVALGAAGAAAAAAAAGVAAHKQAKLQRDTA